MKNKKTDFLSVRLFRIGVALCALITCMLLALLGMTVLHGSFFIVTALAVATAVIGYISYRWVYLPYRETAKILHLFATGYTVRNAFELRYPLSPEMEAAMWKMKDFFDAQDLINASKRQAQYLALQNQINPHFLYNTLEGIRGEAIAADMANVAEMTEALATFFRYTISNVENMVTLEDELHNVENYFLIQQYRFGNRLHLHMDCLEEDRAEAIKCRMPKLTLQPIVENAIIHGVERKAGEGIVRIKLEMTAKRLILTVSDNGVGMPESLRAQLNARLNALSFDNSSKGEERSGGIAIVNVNNRIKLLFGEEYGVHILSTPSVGTDVSITLPRFTGDVPMGGDVLQKMPEV